MNQTVILNPQEIRDLYSSVASRISFLWKFTPSLKGELRQSYNDELKRLVDLQARLAGMF